MLIALRPFWCSVSEKRAATGGRVFNEYENIES